MSNFGKQSFLLALRRASLVFLAFLTFTNSHGQENKYVGQATLSANFAPVINEPASC